MIKVFDHPLIKVKLTKMRDKNSSHLVFKENLKQIASLMVYEILKNVQLKEKEIQTPLCNTIGYEYKQEIMIVPILRAGLGLVEGISELIPQAVQGHIGIYRDEKTFEAKQYFFKVPNVAKDSLILIVDPMLATGISASTAITLLKNKGFRNIYLVCLVGVEEGTRFIQKNHPDVNIYLAAKDKQLDKNMYIVPGLGDAGDRIFGTK